MKKLERNSMGVVMVGEKGQIVIPKEMRDMSDINHGDPLLLLAEINRGIAITRNEDYLQFAQSIFDAQVTPTEED